MLRLAALLFVPLVLATSVAAAGGGPSPGISIGWDGVADRQVGVRYVALSGARTTMVAAVRIADGRVLRYATVNGFFGVPLVAFDGTAEGLSRDGRTLVLADFGQGAETHFAVLRTNPLRKLKVITVRGRWSFDALSPDGRTIYALQYLTAGPTPRYAVRSISVVTGKPTAGAIVDKREPDEEMNGAPWARVRSANGAWAYTLYVKPGGTAFVHALDTAGRRAFCVDLPWRSTQQALTGVRLELERGGRSLVLSKAGRRLAVVDTQTFRVRALATP
ncbi:MAG: hypothetical protein ACJ744_05380 [Gaiellaceae bacterium]